MTEQEAIKEIKGWSEILMSAGKKCTTLTAVAQDMAIQALEEIQKYRTVGTVEECREAMERQIPKKPMYEGDGYDDCGKLIYDTWICPNCEEDYEVDYDDYDFCPNCGQAIDWRKSDEEGNDDDKDSDESDDQVRTYRHPLADTGTYIL